jgi:hypothetical protein
MKIDYRVLWVEDDPSWYDTTVELFKNTLEDAGFELISERKSNIDEIKEMVASDGLQKYDMLLVDFTLRHSDSGDEIIKYIRDKDVYTDVLFYSSAIQNVTDSMHKYGLEGVYTADRKEIEYKFEIVFKTTIKKIQEINAIRGLIMGETSELDVEIENVFNILIDLSIEDELKPKVEKIFKTDYKEVKKNYLKGCKTKRDCHTSDYKQYFSLSESFRKYDILKEFLKLMTFEGFDLDLFKRYKTEVIEIRNKFAHAKSEEKDGKMLLRGQLGKEDFEFDDTKCIEIRKNLIAHRNNINALKTVLKNE